MERRQQIIDNTKVYTNLQHVIDGATKHNNLSLCTFKPTKLIGVEVIDNPSDELTETEKREIKNANKSLFDTNTCEVEFTGMPPISHKFKIKFEDDCGKISSMGIIDWEISQLFLNTKQRRKNDTFAIKDVIDKLTWMFEERDLHFFLGTMKQMHIRRTKNPYTIIGLFYPPKLKRYQPTLF